MLELTIVGEGSGQARFEETTTGHPFVLDGFGRLKLGQARFEERNEQIDAAHREPDAQRLPQ